MIRSHTAHEHHLAATASPHAHLMHQMEMYVSG
jgi:hypothetical protein